MGFLGLSFVSLATLTVVLVVIFFFYTWFKTIMARAFGAQRAIKRWVFCSLLFALLAQVMILVAIKFIFYSEISAHDLSVEKIYQDGGAAVVGIFVTFLIGVFVYSHAVKLGYFKSLLATVVSCIPMIVLIGGVGLLSALMLGKQQGVDISQMLSMASISAKSVVKEDLILAAEEVCACGDDQDMLRNQLMQYNFIASSYEALYADSESKIYLEELSNKVKICSQGGASALAASAHEKVTEDIVTVSQQEAELHDERTARKDDRPRYREFKLAEVKNYIGAKVRVYRNSADPMIGKLVSVANGSLKVQQRRYGGNVTFPISSKDIESLEAYY